MLQSSGSDNDACLDRGSLYGTAVSIFDPTPGDSTVTCAPDGEGLALGTVFAAYATPDTAQGYEFTGWYAATGTSMITGSRERYEVDMLQGDVDLRGFFVRQKMEVPRDGLAVITIEPQDGVIVTEDAQGDRTIYGAPGSTVRLSAVSTDPGQKVVGWEIKAGPSGVNPKYSRESSVTVPVGAYARPVLSSSFVEPLRIELPVAQGGQVLAADCYQWGGAFLHTLAPYSASPIDLAAVANPGWEFVEWQMAGLTPEQKADASLTGLSATQINEAIALFAKQSEYILDIEVIDVDGGDSKCAGYVTVDPAKKYYYATDGPVELTARPQTGYRFLGWDGDFPLIPHQPTPEIEVDVAALGTDWTIRAAFGIAPHVTNLHPISVYFNYVNGWLTYTYSWESSTGHLGDLAGITLAEVTSYDLSVTFEQDVLPFLRSGNSESDEKITLPPPWDVVYKEIPRMHKIQNVQATSEFSTDNHGIGGYPLELDGEASVIQLQWYVANGPDYCENWYALNSSPYEIRRTFSRNPDGSLHYTITKHGTTYETDLP